MLGPGNDAAASKALAAWPQGLQLGGGITADNAQKWLDAGAEKVGILMSTFCVCVCVSAFCVCVCVCLHFVCVCVSAFCVCVCGGVVCPHSWWLCSHDSGSFACLLMPLCFPADCYELVV